MAKRRASKTSGLVQTGWEPMTPSLRHVNTQTFGANATTEIGEAISNPGYSDVNNMIDARTGLLIEAAGVMGDFDSVFALGAAGNATLASQIQVGDRTGTPECLNPGSAWLIAGLDWRRFNATSGAQDGVWPKPMFMHRRPPIVVVPEITITHYGSNLTTFNSLNIYTIIFYRVVRMTDQLFSVLLQDQQRVS